MAKRMVLFFRCFSNVCTRIEVRHIHLSSHPFFKFHFREFQVRKAQEDNKVEKATR